MLKSHSDRVEMLKNSPVVPYTIDGKRDIKMFDFMHILHNHWECDPRYVGIIPGGSRIRGNALDGSDIEFYFLGGTSLTTKETARQEEIADIGAKNGIQASFMRQVSESCLHANISHPESEFSDELNLLMRPMIGIPAKIQHFHFLLRARLTDPHPQVDLQLQVTHAIHHLLDDDFGGISGSFYDKGMSFAPDWKLIESDDHFYKQYRENRTLYKMLQRGFTREEINAIFEARKNMWRQRIQHLIDGTGPFHHLGHTEPFEDIMKMLGDPI